MHPALQAKLERFDREKFAISQMLETDRARFQFQKYLLYKSTPWEFLRDCVFTLDQTSSSTPIKPFPCHYDYLELATYLWLKHNLTAWPKSRRMTASWNFISLYTHDTIFNQGRFNAFVARKEESAGDLVSRAQFIVENIPDWRIPKELLPKIRGGSMTKKPPVLEFEEIHSKIQGFPQGADQLRQFTLSGIFGDEAAFWEDAQKFYAASKPTIDGGGRMTLVSSRAPGFFKKIVFDKTDSKDMNFPEIPPAPVKYPMTGIEVWKNPRNSFLICDIHYTANPDKRSEEWKATLKGSMPSAEWEMEYEKSWDAHLGKPVFPDFKKSLHSTKQIEFEPGLPLLIGFDFGLTPAALLCQQVGGQFRALKEFIETDGPISKLAPVVWSWIATNLPEVARNADKRIMSFIDPSGVNRDQVEGSSCKLKLMECGFKNIFPGPVTMSDRRGAIETFLIRVNKHGPGFLISEEGCPITLEGLGGGFKYPESYLEVEPNNPTPIKNKWSHPCEALEYVAHGALNNLTSNNYINIETPHYGFQKG